MSILPCLPPEVLKHIIDFVEDVATQKNISLTSRQFNGLVSGKLWSVTRLNGPEGISVIRDLPIQELNITGIGFTASDFSIISTMNGLRSLDISSGGSFSFFASADITDTGMVHLAALTRLEVLNISGCGKVGPAGLEAIASLPLKELHVSMCRCNDSHLKVIGKITSLSRINLSHNRDITDAGMALLVSLNRLQNIDISCCDKITHSGLSAIGCLPIKCIVITGICSDLHLKVISKFDSLIRLTIYNSNKVSDVGLTHVSGLTKLQYIDIGMCTNITPTGLSAITNIQALCFRYVCSDSHLAMISKFTNLMKLDISFSHDVTDVGLARISSLSKLQHLNINGCEKITPTMEPLEPLEPSERLFL